MNPTNKIFSLFPFLFPKRKKEIRAKLERALRERCEVVGRRLQVGSISKPRLKFWLSGSNPFYLNGSIFLSYSMIFKSPEKQLETLDHEVTHHIQHSVNPHIKMSYSFEFLSFFYWVLTGKLRYGLANSSFQEGFATYVAYLTNGKLPKRVESGIIIVQERKRLKMLLTNADVIPYVLGYLAYAALAQTLPEADVLQAGVSATVTEWVRMVESSKLRN
jgi:hypothetical protein